MSTPLDPYREWLGITIAHRPLTYFQLLGVSASESRAEIISRAAEAQSAKLVSHLTGPQGRLAKRLLIELDSAKNCLLDSSLRERYLEATGTRGAPAASTGVKPSLELRSNAGSATKNSLGLDIDASLLGELLDEAPAVRKIEEPETPSRPRYETYGSRWEQEPEEDSGGGWPSWLLYVGLGVASLVVGALIYENLSSAENASIVAEQPAVLNAANTPVPAEIAPSLATNPPNEVPVAPVPSANSEPQDKVAAKLPPAVAVPVFAGLPEYVDLPVLNRLTVGHDEALFEQRPPTGIECKLTLTNPQQKTGDRTRFDLHPPDDSTDGQTWQVDLVTTVNSKSELNSNVKETRTPVARFNWGDAFRFRWLKGAEELPGDDLRSCGLEIEGSGQQHFICLRSPQKIERLLVDLDQAFKPLPIVGLGLPDPDLWILELIRIEGASMQGSSTATGPQTAKGTRGSIRVPIGASELGAEIVLKLAELRGQTVLRVIVQYQDIDNKTLPLTNERMAVLQRTLPREFDEAQAKLTGVHSRQSAYVTQLRQAQNVLSRDASNEQARIVAIDCEAQLEHLLGQEKTLLKRLPLMQKRIGRFKALADACRQVHQNLRLHVRVICLAETHPVELMTTE